MGINKIKSLWIQIRTGRSLTNYHRGQNRLGLGKSNLLPTEIGLDSDKQGQKLKPLPRTLLFPGLSFTPSWDEEWVVSA